MPRLPPINSAYWDNTTESPVWLGDLDNEIHPIFQQCNFPGADYSVLEPALRLASQFLWSDALLHFWHAMFLGPRKEDAQLTAKYGEPITRYYRRQDKLSTKDIAETRLHLIRLASRVKFTREHDAQTNRISGGTTRPDWWNEEYAAPYGHGCSGCGSSIAYNESSYQELLQVDRFDAAWKIKQYFDFAALLLHEVAHAAENLMRGMRFEYPLFFEDSVIAEAGYEWEAFTFGGTVERAIYHARPSDPSKEVEEERPWDNLMALDLVEWPNIIHFTNSDPPAAAPKEAFSDVVVMWRMPLSLIQKLFTKDFWEVEVKEKGRKALHASREIGYRFSYTTGYVSPRVRWNCSIPEGFEVDRYGMLVRMAPWTD